MPGRRPNAAPGPQPAGHLSGLSHKQPAAVRSAARSARPARLKSKFPMQCLAEPVCYLVHCCLRYMAGGISADQSEHARTAQVSLKAGLAGDYVEVNVLEAFRFGEQRHVGLAASGHIPQRGADGFEQCSQICGFIGGEVIERDGMTARDKHQPAGQRRAECVGNPPSRPQVDPLSCRQICPRVVRTTHALPVSWHEPHSSRTVFRSHQARALPPQPASTGATDSIPSRSARGRDCGSSGVSGPITPGVIARRERCRDDRDTRRRGTRKRKDKPELTAEQKLAEELVRPGPRSGSVPDGPGWAAEAADQDGPGDRAQPGDDRAPRS